MLPIEHNQAYKLIKKEGVISVFINLILFVAKLWGGMSSGSLAIISDAWHTLTDSASSVIILISNYFSKKPADRDHPFGHGRIDLVATVVIAILLVLISFGFLSEAWEKYSNKSHVNYSTAALIVIGASAIVKEILAWYAFYIAKRTQSRVMHAEGWHHRSDAISSGILLVGMFCNQLFWWIDSVLCVIISLMILYTAFKILRQASSKIMGEKPDAEIIKKITTISKQVFDGDMNIHHIHQHRYGNHIEITFHIYLPGTLSLAEANQITAQLREGIRTNIGVEATIYVDAKKKNLN